MGLPLDVPLGVIFCWLSKELALDGGRDTSLSSFGGVGNEKLSLEVEFADDCSRMVDEHDICPFPESDKFPGVMAGASGRSLDDTEREMFEPAEYRSCCEADFPTHVFSIELSFWMLPCSAAEVAWETESNQGSAPCAVWCWNGCGLHRVFRSFLATELKQILSGDSRPS